MEALSDERVPIFYDSPISEKPENRGIKAGIHTRNASEWTFWGELGFPCGILTRGIIVSIIEGKLFRPMGEGWLQIGPVVSLIFLVVLVLVFFEYW